MSDVIVLNDSNDSSSSEEVFEAKRDKGLKRRKSLENSVSSCDFNYPSVHFSYVGDVEQSAHQSGNESDNNVRNIPINSPIHQLSSSCDEDSPKITLSQQTRELGVPGTSYGNNLNKGRHSYHSLSDSDDSNTVRGRAKKLPLESTATSKNMQKVKSSKGKTAKDTNKDKAKEERLLKKQNLMKEKALKTIAARKLKNMKPGDCMKFMEVMFDQNLKSLDFYNEAIAMLNSSEVKHSTPFYSIPNSVTWKRNAEDYYLNDNNEICTSICPEVENQMIIIWNWEKVVNAVADGTFSTAISSIKDLVPNYNLTVVIYKIENYFASFEKSKHKSKGDKAQKRRGSYENIKNSPTITRDQLETSLTEIQVYSKCNSRLVDTVEDLALMIYQYTKSIAEMPFKAEKNKSLETNYDWYVSGDKKGTVNVNKDGHGMKRLWQQQLCQFNLMSLEVAETICSKYPSPLALMEAYMNCTPQEGANLLKDVPIRRAAGPLTTSRKIGPELSRKIYIMFTAENGKTPLG